MLAIGKMQIASAAQIHFWWNDSAIVWMQLAPQSSHPGSLVLRVVLLRSGGVFNRWGLVQGNSHWGNRPMLVSLSELIDLMRMNYYKRGSLTRELLLVSQSPHVIPSRHTPETSILFA